MTTSGVIPRGRVSMPSCAEFRKKAQIEKVWSLQCSAFPHSPRVLTRLDKLTRLGERLEPPVLVIKTPDSVIIRQKFVNRLKKLDQGEPLKVLDSLVEKVRFLQLNKLVHGDLSYGNLAIGSGDRVQIFDWEPFLVITDQNGKQQLRSSKYAYLPEERGLSSLTVKSDMYALANLIPQVVLGRYAGLSFALHHEHALKHFADEISEPRRLRGLVVQLIAQWADSVRG